VYATQADMITRYGVNRLVQLTDLSTPQTGEIVDETLIARLDDASAEIDGYLVGRVVTPMASVPAHIRLLCCRIAYALLMGDGIDEATTADLAAARGWLRDVARGVIPLSTAQEATAAATSDDVAFNPGSKDWGRERSDVEPRGGL
jgi:phage gp36-like protein